MKCIIFTQDERLYLPMPIAIVVEELKNDIECIVLSPPMSTHGGFIKGIIKHLPIFGVKGTFIMGTRTLIAKIGPLLGVKPMWSNYWSIEDLATSHGIPVHKVGDVNSEEMDLILREKTADLLISVSCPQVIKKQMLDQFKHGGINVHSAPLPKYRGLMPGFWILYHGEENTAVTVHNLGDKLDNGDILLQMPVKVESGETWDSLISKTKEAAGHALVKAIKNIEMGTVKYIPNNDEDATYFSFPSKKDAKEFRRRGRRMF